MEPVYYVSIVAQFLTYASFLSGAKVCHIIHQQKSCAKLSPMPFLAGLNCTALWLRYGFIANEWEIIAVNVVGVSCQIVYLAFFVAYSRQKSRLLKQLLSLLVFLLALFWAIQNSVDPLFLAGSLASLASLIACASPLATIQDVFKTKCVASLPFPIIASSFVVSLSWLTFGYLKEDNFIIFSNAVAVAISGAQLILFVVYPSTYAYQKLTQSNKKSYVSNINKLMLAWRLFISTGWTGKGSDEVVHASLFSTLSWQFNPILQTTTIRSKFLNHTSPLLRNLEWISCCFSGSNKKEWLIGWREGILVVGLIFCLHWSIGVNNTQQMVKFAPRLIGFA